MTLYLFRRLTPARLWNYLNPSPLDLARAQLEEAERERLEQTRSREYHTAMETMLKARVVRLRWEIADMKKDSPA